MDLPSAFEKQMQALLGDEYKELKVALEGQAVYGLRVNTLKITVNEFLEKSPFELRPIPWSRDGFYISQEERPGKHPYYDAGLYYIQEPSAMLPAEILNVQPGEKVLDLCAAPGGKSLQLAAQLQGEGVLVSNDLNTERTKPLNKNFALAGIENGVILNDSPTNLSKVFKEWFDAILVDAPCSGEGMFRRDEQATKSWLEYGADFCEPLQKDILENAARMLKPGGRLVYSTCTFSPRENEVMIDYFLALHPEFELLPINKTAGLQDGRPEWGNENKNLEYTLRAWPHRTEGEGHFVALLKKNSVDLSSSPKSHSRTLKEVENLDLWIDFSKQHLNKTFKGKYITFGNHLYQIPVEVLDLNPLKIVRPGFYLGEFKKNRFEPSHTLALSLSKDDVRFSCNFDCDDNQLIRFFKGETLEVDVPNGWTLVTVDGFGVGWGKVVDGILKNHYPKGWRRQ